MTDERYRRGIEHFNRKSFFEAHEILEDLWHEYRETDRTFLQALIQVSAGLYHLDQENFRGARSQLTKGIRKLEPYAPSHGGLDIGALLRDLHRCLDLLPEIETGSRPLEVSFFPSLQFIQSPHEKARSIHGNDDHGGMH